MILSIVRGTDFVAPAFFQNGDDTPVNLTGFTVTAQITWRTGEVSLLVEAVDLPAGRVQISLTETQTANLPAGAVSTLTIAYVSAGGLTRKDSITVEGV